MLMSEFSTYSFCFSGYVLIPKWKAPVNKFSLNRNRFKYTVLSFILVLVYLSFNIGSPSPTRLAVDSTVLSPPPLYISCSS